MAQRGRPRIADDSRQATVRVSQEWVDRADAIAKALRRDGYGTARADVWRAALSLGLVALEKKHGISTKKHKGAR